MPKTLRRLKSTSNLSSPHPLRVLWLLIFALLHPTSAHCPIGYDLRTGIRRSGAFECWPHPVGDPDWHWGLHRPDRSVQPEGVLRGKIWCGGGVPIVVDDRSVACQDTKR